jgi:hypothetical protein
MRQENAGTGTAPSASNQPPGLASGLFPGYRPEYLLGFLHGLHGEAIPRELTLGGLLVQLNYSNGRMAGSWIRGQGLGVPRTLPEVERLMEVSVRNRREWWLDAGRGLREGQGS